MDRRTPKVDDAYLDTVLVGGREQRQVEIVDYDPSWLDVFEEHRRRILSALGETAQTVEHIGSTAVPGLAAKPIVDIMVTVDDPDDEAAYLGPLEETGCVLRVRETNHRMLRTPERDVHVHIWRAGSDDEERHLIFRDHPRSNPDARDAYEVLKRSLAGQWRDVNYYAEAKGPFIRQTVGSAAVLRDSKHTTKGAGLSTPRTAAHPVTDVTRSCAPSRRSATGTGLHHS